MATDSKDSKRPSHICCIREGHLGLKLSPKHPSNTLVLLGLVLDGHHQLHSKGQGSTMGPVYMDDRPPGTWYDGGKYIFYMPWSTLTHHEGLGHKLDKLWSPLFGVRTSIQILQHSKKCKVIQNWPHLSKLATILNAKCNNKNSDKESKGILMVPLL